MRQYKYLFFLSFLLLSTFAQAQRINPSSRIEKASDSTYILLSDVDGKYQHTKLVAESGISFNISNDTIYISSTATGGGGGVTDITGGLGIDPDGSNTGSITLSFDPTEFGTLSTLDGNEEMWGYSSIVGQPVKHDIQGVFSNVLNDQANGIDFSENGANQINVDLDLAELSLGTTFDGAFLLLGNYGSATERTIYFQHLLKNTLTSTDGSVTFTDDTFTLDLSASGGGGGTDDQKIDTFDIVSNDLRLSLESDGEAAKTVDLSSYLDNTDSQTLSLSTNTLSISGGNSVDLSAYDMNNFNIQADGGASTSITDNQTINFDAGANMTISRTGNTLLFESTGGGSGVSSITGGTGLNPDAASTGAVTMDLDFSELTDFTTWDGDDYLAGRTTLGTEVEGTLQEIFGDMLFSSDASVSIAYDGVSNRYDFTTSGGGGMTSFNIQEDGGTLEAIGDGETVEFVSGSNMNITRSVNDLTFNVTGLDNYSSWTLRADDANTDNIFSGETVDIAGATGVQTTNDLTNLNIFLAPEEFTINSSPPSTDYVWVFDGLGGLERTRIQDLPISGGTQLTQEEVQDYVGTMVSGNTEVGISVTYDDFNNEFDFVATDASTTNELQDFDVAQLSGTDLQLSLTQDATTHTIDLSSLGGGSGMTSWTARTEDLVTTTVSDGTILDFEAGNGLKTQTSLGDVQVLLDGPGLTNLGAINGSYEAWVHSGVITGARTIQNILTDVLTSTDGSVTIGTSENSVNLTATGAADGDANWDDTSVYLSASGGSDISSTTISSTHSDKRNFNVSLNATSASTSNTQLLMPSASSTYQYHIFTVSCADNSGTYNCQISNTVNGTYNMSDSELVVLRASQYEGSWTWFVN